MDGRCVRPPSSETFVTASSGIVTRQVRFVAPADENVRPRRAPPSPDSRDPLRRGSSPAVRTLPSSPAAKRMRVRLPVRACVNDVEHRAGGWVHRWWALRGCGCECIAGVGARASRMRLLLLSVLSLRRNVDAHAAAARLSPRRVAARVC